MNELRLKTQYRIIKNNSNSKYYLLKLKFLT